MRLTALTIAAGLLALGSAHAQTRDGLRTDPPGTAAERAFDRAAGTNTSGAYPSQSDGTRANPPGTAAGRAIDRSTDGRNIDGTTGNPPGTAASRAFDRAAGTNTSGAYPAQSDGMPGNPPGTALGRAIDGSSSGSNRR